MKINNFYSFQIFAHCLKYITYQPRNYEADNNAAGSSMEMETDQDDMSWKVRRSAAKW